MPTFGKLTWKDGSYPHLEEALKHHKGTFIQLYDSWVYGEPPNTRDKNDCFVPQDEWAWRLERLETELDNSYHQGVFDEEKVHALLKHWDNMIRFRAFL